MSAHSSSRALLPLVPVVVPVTRHSAVCGCCQCAPSWCRGCRMDARGIGSAPESHTLPDIVTVATVQYVRPGASATTVARMVAAAQAGA